MNPTMLKITVTVSDDDRDLLTISMPPFATDSIINPATGFPDSMAVLAEVRQHLKA